RQVRSPEPTSLREQGAGQRAPRRRGHRRQRRVRHARARENALLDRAPRPEEEDARARREPLELARDRDRGADVTAGPAAGEEHRDHLTFSTTGVRPSAAIRARSPIAAAQKKSELPP